MVVHADLHSELLGPNGEYAPGRLERLRSDLLDRRRKDLYGDSLPGQAPKVARASLGQIPQIVDVYSGVYGKSYFDKRMKDPSEIERMLTDGNHVWYTATVAGEVVASAVGTIDPNHRNMEIGKTVVAKPYRRSSVATDLCQRIFNETLRRDDVDIFWGQARMGAILKIASGQFGKTAVGYSSRHRMRERETYIHTMRHMRDLSGVRVRSSEAESIYALPGVQRIENELRMGGTDGLYPDVGVLNLSEEETVVEIVARGAYSERHSAVQIHSLQTNLPSNVEFFGATLLAGDLNRISSFLALGYEISGFYPAWYLHEGKRYDVVEMSNPQFEPKCADTSLEEVYRTLRAELNWKFAHTWRRAS